MKCFSLADKDITQVQESHPTQQGELLLEGHSNDDERKLSQCYIAGDHYIIRL